LDFSGKLEGLQDLSETYEVKSETWKDRYRCYRTKIN